MLVKTLPSRNYSAGGNEGSLYCKLISVKSVISLVVNRACDMNGKTIDGNFYMIDNLFGLIRTCTSLTVTQNEELRFQRVFTSRKYIYVCVRL